MAIYNMECGVCKEPATESELVRIDCKDMLMCEVCVNELTERLNKQIRLTNKDSLACYERLTEAEKLIESLRNQVADLGWRLTEGR